MKLSVIILAAILAAYSYNQSGNAKAKKVQGLDVYVYAEPLSDYEVIETGKVTLTLTGGCDEVVNQAIKKAAKLRANAVIVDLSSSRWEAITYK